MPALFRFVVMSLARPEESIVVELPQQSHLNLKLVDLKTSLDLKVCSALQSGWPQTKINSGFCLQKTSRYLFIISTFICSVIRSTLF